MQQICTVICILKPKFTWTHSHILTKWKNKKTQIKWGEKQIIQKPSIHIDFIHVYRYIHTHTHTHIHRKTDMQDEQDQFFFVPSFIPGIIEFIYIYINGILLNTNETTKFQCNNYNISFIHSIAHWFAPIFSCRALGGFFFLTVLYRFLEPKILTKYLLSMVKHLFNGVCTTIYAQIKTILNYSVIFHFIDKQKNNCEFNKIFVFSLSNNL